ncbi:adenine phosphoribosyltransferase [Brevibacterium sanguinis]|uniref:Adenine phosphoribosyltransferase n=2 Tax=Brevibacterium TaxID=1696 RepID=A0A366IR57_9MICO|nr:MULTISPECIES: adenine phosphoribosyltransferase [Brevibacterium]RBP67986.1 adenine phosphoribosyltransferase [Brevibacterium sanguinis]RBP74597.1 adenine phosphoribosyltransferase [Brevibacterium celere]
MTPELARAAALIARIPDHPQPGVQFRDISPLLADGQAMRTVTEALIAPFRGRFDVVAGLEARGFLLAGYVSALTGAGILPVRKAGKLPRPAASVSYSLEYGTATIEGPDVLRRGDRVLLVDDILATGGTLQAARALVGELGADVIGVAVVLELEELGGRALSGDVHAVITD